MAPITRGLPNGLLRRQADRDCRKYHFFLLLLFIILCFVGARFIYSLLNVMQSANRIEL